MRKILLAMAATAFAACGNSSSSGVVGTWVLDMGASLGGEAAKAEAKLKEEEAKLATMPAEQRRMMEGMLAKAREQLAAAKSMSVTIEFRSDGTVTGAQSGLQGSPFGAGTWVEKDGKIVITPKEGGHTIELVMKDGTLVGHPPGAPEGKGEMVLRRK